ncbi:MAG: hypothetical protein RSB50_09425 [Cetobacterium sp.]
MNNYKIFKILLVGIFILLGIASPMFFAYGSITIGVFYLMLKDS